MKLLSHDVHHPLMLIGGNGCGKTALINEYIKSNVGVDDGDLFIHLKGLRYATDFIEIQFILLITLHMMFMSCLCGVVANYLASQARDPGSIPTGTIRFMTCMAPSGER